MLELSNENEYAVIEGDEYLSFLLTEDQVSSLQATCAILQV